MPLASGADGIGILLQLHIAVLHREVVEYLCEWHLQALVAWSIGRPRWLAHNLGPCGPHRLRQPGFHWQIFLNPVQKRPDLRAVLRSSCAGGCHTLVGFLDGLQFAQIMTDELPGYM